MNRRELLKLFIGASLALVLPSKKPQRKRIFDGGRKIGLISNPPPKYCAYSLPFSRIPDKIIMGNYARVPLYNIPSNIEWKMRSKP